MRIVCSAGAPEFEEVPRSRLKLSWIIQLQYRLVNTFAVSELLAGTRAGLAKLLVKDVIGMSLGAVMLPKSLFSNNIPWCERSFTCCVVRYYCGRIWG
jgi:hypothetical protein